MSYRDEIQEILLSAGIHGIEQQAITIKLRNKVKAEAIRQELESLNNRDLIQKFIRPPPKHGGPPQIIWRATTALADHYYPK